MEFIAAINHRSLSLWALFSRTPVAKCKNTLPGNAKWFKAWFIVDKHCGGACFYFERRDPSVLWCLLAFSAQDFVSRETECAECLINAATSVAMRSVARARMLAWKIQNNPSVLAHRLRRFYILLLSAPKTSASAKIHRETRSIACWWLDSVILAARRRFWYSEAV